MRTVLYDEIQDSILCKEYPYKGCEIVSADSIFRNPPQLDVSVIVPCYNVERFLPECIESLAAQKTQYTYEVILINDGSTDGTRELAEDAAKRYPVFHCIHQDNQGCGAARNQGMRNAKGEYLLFVDADDTTSSNYVEELVGCVKYSGADMGICAYYSFNENGVRYKKVEWPRDVKTIMVNGTPWAKIFRRELFDRLLWPSGYWQEDTILAFLVFPRVRLVAVTNRCTYGYRSNMQNITHSSKKSPKCLSTLYLTSIILSHMVDFGLEKWLGTLDGHDRLVNQFFLNQCRTKCLPEECRREVFRLQSAYYNRITPYESGKHHYDSRLYALALKKNSTAIWKSAVRLEKVNKVLRLISARMSAILRRT